MKIKKIISCIAACVVSAFAVCTTGLAGAQDTILRFKAGSNDIYSSDVPKAENPIICGDAMYSAYVPVEPASAINELSFLIQGIGNTVYPDIAVTFNKIRVDGKEITLTTTPVIDYNYREGEIFGTKVTIVDDQKGVYSISRRTPVEKSIEVIFTVSGMGINGPVFNDTHAEGTGTSESSTDPSGTDPSGTEASENTAETTQPATGGFENVTRETTATSVSTGSSTQSSSVSSSGSGTTSVSVSSTSAGGGFSGWGSSGSSSGSPQTNEKGVLFAFIGLGVTAAAAVAVKIKGKK